MGTVRIEPPPPIKPKDRPINIAAAYPAISTHFLIRKQMYQDADCELVTYVTEGYLK